MASINRDEYFSIVPLSNEVVSSLKDACCEFIAASFCDSCDVDNAIRMIQSLPEDCAEKCLENLVEVLCTSNELDSDRLRELVELGLKRLRLSGTDSGVISLAYLLPTIPGNSSLTFHVDGIVSLTMSGSNFLTDELLLEFSHRLKSVRELDVSSCAQLSSEAVSIITSCAYWTAGLKKLNLSYLNLGDSGCLYKLQALTEIKCIALSRIRSYEPFYFQYPAGQLRELDLSGLTHMSDDNIRLTLEGQLESIRELHINESAISSASLFRVMGEDPSQCEDTEASEPDMPHSSRKADTLRTSSPRGPTMCMMDRCHAYPMVSLDLSWCENLESEAIGKALRRMPSLRRALLRATKADSDTVSIIAKYCPYLVELNLARCDAIDDNALTALARAAEERSESFLRSLDLSWSLVSDTGLIPLLTISRHMEALGLQGCKSLSAGLVLYLLDDQRFPLHSSVAETVRSQNMTTRNESTGRAEMAGLHRERSPSPSVMAVGMAVPDLQFIDLSWVNMFHKDLAVRLSKARRHLKVVDYYNEVYENGKVIAEFI